MKTIIKGKNMKNTYEFVNEDKFSILRQWNRGLPDIIENIQDMIYHEEWTRIKTASEFESHDTYATLQDINYRLNIGEEYEGNTIEKVEGTKDGYIIYYTDKVLSIDENLEEKSQFQEELNNRKQKLKEWLEREIAERDKKKWWQFWR